MFVRFHLVLAVSVVLCGHNAKPVTATESCTDITWMHDDDYCHYPLHWAALSGDVEGALYAIQLGKNINEKIPGYGTPLHQAAFYGRAPVVKLLLQNGADVAALDLDGDTPIRATRKEWCSRKPNDRTCQLNTSDYIETKHLLSSDCKTIGCSSPFQCLYNKCINLCDGIQCGFNAVCTVHNNQAICHCSGDDYSGDPTIMCLEMGDAKYIYKAYRFVKDVVTNIASAIVKDVKSFMKK